MTDGTFSWQIAAPAGTDPKKPFVNEAVHASLSVLDDLNTQFNTCTGGGLALLHFSGQLNGDP